jgi:hypothetical protein
MERRGEPSDRGGINREIARRNATLDEMEASAIETAIAATVETRQNFAAPAAAEKSPEGGTPTYPASPANAPAATPTRPKIAAAPEMPETPAPVMAPPREPDDLIPHRDITASHIDLAPAAEPEREIEHDAGGGFLAGIVKPVENFLGSLGAPGAIKGLFREAVKAITRQAKDEAPAPRRRRGETEGEFRKLARNLSRHYHDMRQDFRQRASITSRFLTIPADAYAFATAYLSGAFDQLTQINDGIDPGGDYGESFDANSKHIFPEP